MGDSLRASLERFALQHQNQQMDSRERMRNAWGSLRDRLSRRAAADSPRTTIPTPPAPAADVAPANSPTDPHERMLADMARAFQLGSGANSPGDDPSPAEEQASTPSSSSSSSSDTSQDQEHSEPAEGSFERFLVDLQNDLRVALSSEDFLGDRSQNSSTDNDNGGPDSDSGINLDGIPTMPETNHIPDTQAPESNTTSSIEHRGGNINWWRSYQFPQVATAPLTHGPIGPQHTTNSGSSPMFTAHSPPTPSPTTSTLLTHPPASSTHQQAPLAEVPSSTENNSNPNVVVPAIVVGLYSMNNRRRASIFGGNQTPHTSPDDSEPVDDDNDDGLSGREPHTGGRQHDTQRGRSWHSRAANAFRSLRPGRRRRETNEGSRSFMIYVIGGELLIYRIDYGL